MGTENRYDDRAVCIRITLVEYIKMVAKVVKKFVHSDGRVERILVSVPKPRDANTRRINPWIPGALKSTNPDYVSPENKKKQKPSK